MFWIWNKFDKKGCKLKLIQISPTSYDEAIIKKSNIKNVSFTKKILIVNSMLDPNTKYPQEIMQIINNFDSNIAIEVQSISQVEKKNIGEWYAGVEGSPKNILLIVGDCATCTYKASQDIFTLNERGINSHLLTFKEMNSLIISKLKKQYIKKILFVDDSRFNELLIKSIMD